jgi:DNA-binding MarR family transcriptional regulator
MWDRYDPRDGDRDRGSAWDRSLGGRGSTSDRDRNEERDPRDVFTQDLDLPRGSERRPVRERERVYEIDGTESCMLATIGAFRVVSETDLHDLRDDSYSPRRSARHLEREGLIRTSPLSSDDRAVVLTDRGRDLLEANRYERHDRVHEPRQTFYAGLRNPMLKWDIAWRALRDAAGLPGLRVHDLRHTVITELAEMGVADHVLESISGHLSRRMLEHYSHIRIDAKRQALDALDAARRSTAHDGDGNEDGANQTEIPAIVEVSDDLTPQSRHSLVLRGSPPAGKLLIPLERRDVRVVEGARLEIGSLHAC